MRIGTAGAPGRRSWFGGILDAARVAGSISLAQEVLGPAQPASPEVVSMLNEFLPEGISLRNRGGTAHAGRDEISNTPLEGYPAEKRPNRGTNPPSPLESARRVKNIRAQSAKNLPKMPPRWAKPAPKNRKLLMTLALLPDSSANILIIKSLHLAG